MTKIACKIILLLGTLITTSALAEENIVVPAGDYLIGAGDLLEISVWKEDALSKELTVLPDGKLTFPLIGNIVAAGRTANEIKAELSTRLKRFVSDPIVSVGVQQVNSLIIYVVGKVNKPDMFILNTRIKVLQALAMAGGLNQFAKSKQIRIFRDTGSDTSIFTFNYNQVSQGKKLEQNILLQRGDVIVVR